MDNADDSFENDNDDGTKQTKLTEFDGRQQKLTAFT